MNLVPAEAISGWDHGTPMVAKSNDKYSVRASFTEINQDGYFFKLEIVNNTDKISEVIPTQSLCMSAVSSAESKLKNGGEGKRVAETTNGKAFSLSKSVIDPELLIHDYEVKLASEKHEPAGLILLDAALTLGGLFQSPATDEERKAREQEAKEDRERKEEKNGRIDDLNRKIVNLKRLLLRSHSLGSGEKVSGLLGCPRETVSVEGLELLFRIGEEQFPFVWEAKEKI